MRSRDLGSRGPTGRAWRRLLVGGAALCALMGTVTAVTAPARAEGEEPEPPVSDITMVQANIYTGLTVERFQADVRTVLSLAPDFVTYNEVPFRNDAVMAPEGYDIYRSMRNRFTAATPVAWREDRWQAIDQGTYRISDWRGKPPGRQVELGRRFANWVTLQDTDGRVVSVVSVHVAPVVRGMPDLLRPSVTRLGKLVDQLAPSGPVLVGGDFNVHYKSGRYPRDILSAHGLVPTFDVMGSFFPTGDHQGATIDYVFDRGVDALTPDNQYAVELKSDHDAVVAGLSWTTDLPSETVVVTNDPRGDVTGQRAALESILDGLRSAQPGTVVELATYRLELPAVVRQLSRALDRGVHVRVSTASDARTKPERRLGRILASHGDPHSWLRRCGASCRTTWRDAGVPRGFMMVSDPDGTWKARYDASRKLAPVLVEKLSRVRISTGSNALEEGAELLRAVR